MFKKRLKVFISREIPKSGIDLLKAKGYLVKINPYDRVLKKDELIKMAKGYDAIMTMLTDKVDKEFLEGIGPNLKIVANYAVGFDNINVKDCEEKGVIATNTPGVLTQAVAEHTFALMLALAKRVLEANNFAKAGKYKGWAPLFFLGTELKNKVLGIVGLGRIGRIVAQMAVKGMGMRVMYADLHRQKDFEKDFGAKYVDLKTLLKEADFVTLHVPLLPSTHHLIGEKELKMMKKTAFLINTSRGPVVDEQVLIEAVEKGKIKGAAIDVFECEPAFGCSEEARKKIKQLDNYIVTPHIASATEEARSEMADLAAHNIIAVLSGKKPLTPVTSI